MMAQAAQIASTDTDIVRTSEGVGPRAIVRRIQAEYLEMPGLTLTAPQAARLWNLNAHQSEALLAELVDRRFLTRDRNGAYRRPGCPRC